MKTKRVLGGRDEVKVAVAQAAPVFMDKEATLEKACRLVREAGREGAELVAFPETFVPGYPAYYTGGWESRPAEWGPYMVALQDNALVVGSEDTEAVGRAAREAGACVVLGCNELDDREGSRTVYNTLLFFSNDGRLLGRHRKLMPTFTERTYWGWGDASDLQVYDTDIGRIGGLICGENIMVLVKAAMMHKAEEFHVAVWPGAWSGHGREHIMEPETEPLTGSSLVFPEIRSYAIEGQCFVLSACGILTDKDIPPAWAHLKESDHMSYGWSVGGSAIVNPYGRYAAGPLLGEETLVYATCHANQIKLAKAIFDMLGHYARWDVVRLQVRREGWAPEVESPRLPEPSPAELRRLAEKYEVDPVKLEALLDELHRTGRTTPS